MDKNIEFKVEKDVLRGTLFTPDGDGPFPGVVSFHGSRSDRTRGVDVGKRLVNKGYVVLAFDFRGHGSSEGDISKLTFADYINDGQAAIEFLINQGADADRLGLRGGSMGGYVASCLAVKNNAKSLVLLVPAAFGEKDITINESQEKGRDLLNDRSSWKKSEPIEQIKKFKGSLLVVRNELDELLSPEMTEAFYKEANSAHVKKLEIIAGAKHSVHDNPEAMEKLQRLTVDWFLKTL